MRRVRLAFASVLLTSLASCTSASEATITLTTGEELDTFSRAPAPTTLVVETIDSDGRPREIARTPLPTELVDLGEMPRTDIGAIRVRAYDAAGTALLKGESLYVQYGALEEQPFEVFVQRARELARLPRPPAALDAPRLDVALGRYIVGANGTTGFVYDLLLLRTLNVTPTFPRPVKSLAAFGTAAIVIDEAGASSFDLSTGVSQDLAAPEGGRFDEIAGGATVTTESGDVYVVGATRPDVPTTRVFIIKKDGNTSFATLAVPRAGACAAWVPGRGLLVAGGSAHGAGAEILPEGVAVGAPLPIAPDAVTGCAATALTPAHVLVIGGVGSPADVGGVAPARVLDLGRCAATCTFDPWPGAVVPLVRAQAITLGTDAALVAGDDASGATRVFRASAAGPVEIPLKVPRKNARLVKLPVTNTAAIIGGGASIEHYVD